MTEIDELSRWKNIIKERILNHKADITIIAAATWLIEKYQYDERDDEIPDWMSALANCNPDLFIDGIQVVRSLIEYDEKEAK